MPNNDGKNEFTPLLERRSSEVGSNFYFVEKQPSIRENQQVTSAVKWGQLVQEKSVHAEERMLSPPKQFLQKVEPKIFFSCERTFIAWMHASSLLAGTSMAIVAFSDKTSIRKQLYGVLMLPLAIIFLGYALWQYASRTKKIRIHSPGPYEDVMGPVILTITLMVAICLSFLMSMHVLF